MTSAGWVAFIERHARAVCVASLLLCLAAALSLTRLRLDIEVLSIFPQGTPAFDDFKRFVAEFGQLDELFILVEATPPSRAQRFADALAQRLAALDTVAAVQYRIDADRVLAGMLGRYLPNYLPEPAYDELAARLTPAGIDAQIAANRAVLSAPFDLSAARAIAGDPLGLRRLAARPFRDAYAGVAPALDAGYFTSQDGRALLLFVRPAGAAFDVAFSERLMEQVRGAVEDTRRALTPSPATLAGEGGGEGTADVRVAFTGAYVYAIEDAATLRADVARYTVLALLGILAVFYLGFGNLRVVPFVAYPLVVTTLVTFALSLLLFEQLNAVSISFAAILYGLCIDTGIHFYSRLVEERRHAGARGAITAVVAGLGRANVASSTTTAAAFLVVGLSCLGAIRQLGILTALGMLVTVVEFFTLYPALAFVLGDWSIAGARPAESPRLERWAAAAVRRARGIRAATAAIGAGLAVAAWAVPLDASLDRLRPADSDAVRVQEEIAARFGRDGHGGAVLVRDRDLDRALAEGERVAARLRAYQADGSLRSVQSVDAVLPSADTQRARLERYNALPRAAALDLLRTALRAHGFVPERFGDFFAAFAAPRHDVVRLGDPALEPLGLLTDRHVRAHNGEYVVATYFEPAAGVTWSSVADRLRADLGGAPIAVAARGGLEEQLSLVLRRELALFLALGFLGNLALLLAAFRSLRTAAAILAPVALVVFGLFALMRAAGVPLDPVNLIVIPLLFGIGVDDGVYLAAAARQRGSVPAAVRHAGRALTMTSLTTVAGFGFLAFSAYPPLAVMGRLAALGLLGCLLAAIVVLPALLPPTRS